MQIYYSKCVKKSNKFSGNCLIINNKQFCISYNTKITTFSLKYKCK